MRKALLEKLNDPHWKAQQERRYRQIMGESDIAFTTPPARSRESIPVVGTTLPSVEEEPKSIEALWTGNWQRSLGALTITRFPDDTVVLDSPSGDRTLFRSCPAPRTRFSWLSETQDAIGSRTYTYRCPDRYETEEEALLEMHRAAMARFLEIAGETEG